MVFYRLKGRDFLCLADFTRSELMAFLETAKMLKERYYAGEIYLPLLKGRQLAMIFQKPSTRTRVSFEVAIEQLGGHALYLGWKDLQLGRGETVADTARVLSRYVHGIMARVYEQRDLEELARYADVPVINGLSNLTHPAQALSDMYTIWEHKGRLEGLKLVFVGDGADNMAHSLLIAAAKLGLHMVIATPKGYDPDPEIYKRAEEAAQESGAVIEVTRDPREAVKGADIVYTDVWVSMGQEEEMERRMKDLAAYQVNSELMRLAKPTAVFMHCLPAHRGQEVTDEVIDGPQSVVWTQAENRLHVQKAILALLMK